MSNLWGIHFLLRYLYFHYHQYRSYLLLFQHWRWRRVTDFTYGPSGKECWGSYNTTSQKGWGPGYENSCIHSGTITSSGDLPTNWYNYVLATAGTIVDKNTSSENPVTNTNPATESICPRGWMLPNNTQIQSIGDNSSTYISSFSPVLGGRYINGSIGNETTHGYWWGSEAYNGAARYSLYYNSDVKLYLNNYFRYTGYYIRCVQAP